MNSKWLREFKNPGLKYHSAPFWSWNDRLDPHELRRQIRDMVEHGMGGAFMRSRVGLETEYMGAEWLECICQTVDEAKKVGAYAFLYDEDRWPSGFAGGLVTKKGDAYRQKYLEAEVFEKVKDIPIDAIRTYSVKVKGRKLVSARDISRSLKIKPGEKILAFVQRICDKLAWYNNDSYSDNLNPECVRVFIETTYEVYRKEIGSEFGKTVPGIFTDEPHISPHVFSQKATSKSLAILSWTANFPEYFKKRRGYEFWKHAPELVFKGKNTAMIAHDYWHTITELFEEAYSKQLGQWCKKHNIAYTGHYLAESSLKTQVETGGAMMPHYQWQQMPGIDLLTEDNIEILTAKQCSSVARQFGRTRVLSELYGCTGWEFTFEGMKFSGDWQVALGINYRCPHLALYTLRGCAKRDYPPSFNYNTTWWKHNKVMEDYFARLCYMMTRGESVRDVLVIHPVSSAWAIMDGSGDSGSKVAALDSEFKKMCEMLLGMHCDFDFGDEIILKRHGRVQGNKFRVNKVSYNMVVVSSMLTLFPATLALLKKFLKHGGKVVALSPTPTMLAGRLSSDVRKFFKYKDIDICENLTELHSKIVHSGIQRVHIYDTAFSECNKVWYHLRRAGKSEILFLTHLNRKNFASLIVAWRGKGRIEEFDLLTGERRAVSSQVKAGSSIFTIEMPPTGSKLYVMDVETKPYCHTSMCVAEESPSRIMYLGPLWKFRRTELNSLPLDMCRYSLNDRALSKSMPVWQVQRRIREILGLQPNHTNSGPQRWVLLKNKKDLTGQIVKLVFTFDVCEIPERLVYLVLEGSEHFRIELNGKHVMNHKVGWWLDRSFHKISLPRFTKGINTLVLMCEYKDEMQIENCYLAGDFAVSTHTPKGMASPSRAIERERKFIRTGDWVFQGYPFFAGGIIYETKVKIQKHRLKRVILRIGNYKGITASISVNGKPAGVIPWAQADGVDIIKFLHNGLNKIDIEVAGSPKNLLGPLHNAKGKTAETGCGEFTVEGDNYTPEYILFPWGLMQQVALRLYAKN